jgi:hypothetical protein
MYKLYVRDSELNRIAEIDDYTSLEMILRFNAPSTWVLILPTDSIAAKELSKPKYGINVTKDGETLLSGNVAKPNRKWDASQDTTTVSGLDDTAWLEKRLAYPVPSGPPYTSTAYDVRTGAAETIIHEFVDYNAGPRALPERQVPKLVLGTNLGRGNVVTGRARFHSLIERLRALALVGGGLGFRIKQVGKNLEFQTYQPTDKTKEVIFSPLLGNLRAFEYGRETAETNYVIVGGGGQGTSRTFIERGDSTSISKYGRHEAFVDQRNTSETSELEQSIDEELEQKAEKYSLSISPVDTDSMTFGRDYNLGDKVSIVLTQPNEVIDVETVNFFISSFQTVQVENERVRKIQEKLEVIQDVVREVKISITPEGVSVTPSIGTPESISKSILGIFDQVKKLGKRIGNLERS